MEVDMTKIDAEIEAILERHLSKRHNQGEFDRFQEVYRAALKILEGMRLGSSEDESFDAEQERSFWKDTEEVEQRSSDYRSLDSEQRKLFLKRIRNKIPWKWSIGVLGGVPPDRYIRYLRLTHDALLYDVGPDVAFMSEFLYLQDIRKYARTTLKYAPVTHVEKMRAAFLWAWNERVARLQRELESIRNLRQDRQEHRSIWAPKFYRP